MIRAALLFTALTSGSAAALLMSGTLPAATGAASPAVVQPVSMDEVLVAARGLERGAKVGADDLRWHAWPSEAVIDSFVLRSHRPDAIADFAGSVARNGLPADIPVLATELAPAGASLLSAVLGTGMRAVAIAISAESTAGGFVLPEDRVDVVTMPCRNGSCAGIVARTILKNVRVLAIDQSGGESTSEASLIGKTATLELSPAQAEVLVGAEATGTLSLVLRSAADRNEPVEQVEQAAIPHERPQLIVRVWRKGVREDVSLQ